MYTANDTQYPETGLIAWDIYDPKGNYICTVHTEVSKTRLLAHLNSLV